MREDKQMLMEALRTSSSAYAHAGAALRSDADVLIAAARWLRGRMRDGNQLFICMLRPFGSTSSR